MSIELSQTVVTDMASTGRSGTTSPAHGWSRPSWPDCPDWAGRTGGTANVPGTPPSVHTMTLHHHADAYRPLAGGPILLSPGGRARGSTDLAGQGHVPL